MEIIYYVIFAFVSWFLLMQIFRFSTYHKYFKFAVFFIIGYAILNSYFLYYFDLHAFSLWHLSIFLFLFYKNYKKQKKVSSSFEHLIDIERGITNSFLKLNLERTLKYYLISALIYLIVFELSFIYFYNR